jgi:hypothetical protein
LEIVYRILKNKNLRSFNIPPNLVWVFYLPISKTYLRLGGTKKNSSCPENREQTKRKAHAHADPADPD